ncbi:MAG TPA: M56 family metallopeptidase [Chitinophaga sp.]|uniref:M56 family metallopeptidase n=1 Tax=Chitinophaga sp. TaxID=1869181 RepID=UPI002BD41AB0|nr:M56 family metallopeptidase [Chitinophaga sp.]HVI47348.1 M56 family metallopeptidase [Chitinophaga sp.]
MNLLPITGDLARALGWAILHAIWQAFFVYACLRVVLKLWPQASARIKYNLSMFSLAGIFTWFLITLYQQLQSVLEVRQMTLQVVMDHAIAVQPAAIYPSETQMVRLFPNLEMCFPILVTLYIIGIVVMTIKLISDLLQLQHIRTHQVQSMGEAWEKHLERLAARLKIPRRVQLLVSGYVQVPVMLGFLKPVILLPVAMVNNLSEEQLEAILLHELAHIRRNDYLLNILQSIVETILFFNPFVWMISRIIRQEREHCCDDLVIASTVQPLHYAQALVALEEYRLTANPLTMAAADNRQHLFHRIKRIMEMKTKHLNYSQKFLAVLIITTGLISIAWLNPVKGKEQKKEIVVEKTSLHHKGTADSSLPVKAAPVAVPAPEPLPAPSADVAPAADPETALAPLSALAATPDTLDPLDTKTDVQVKTNVKTNVNTRVKRNIILDTDESLSPAAREEIRKQVKEAQKSVEVAMRRLKEVDMKRIQAEAKAATEKIDWKAISEATQKAQAEAAAALKNINWDKINLDVQNALDKVDWKGMNEKVTKELAESRVVMERNMKIAHEQMQLAHDRAMAVNDEARQAERSVDASKRVAERAKREAEHAQLFAEDARRRSETITKKYRDLISQMNNDKLLDASKDYTVEKNSSGLYINGVKQPENVLQKYQGYLQSNKITIRKNGTSGFNVNSED